LKSCWRFSGKGQQGVIDKLRSGKYSRQASLNLLHQPAERCRQMLFAFIRQAGRDGLRNLVIIHGKGREQNSHPNVVRSYLARWLPSSTMFSLFVWRSPTTVVAGHVMSHYENLMKQNKITGNVTPSAAASGRYP
jgi:hypothetical protein